MNYLCFTLVAQDPWKTHSFLLKLASYLICQMYPDFLLSIFSCWKLPSKVLQTLKVFSKFCKLDQCYFFPCKWLRCYFHLHKVKSTGLSLYVAFSENCLFSYLQSTFFYMQLILNAYWLILRILHWSFYFIFAMTFPNS